MRPEKPLIHRLRDAVLVIFLVYIAVIALIAFRQSSMMYFPPATVSLTALEQLQDFDVIKVKTADDLELNAYFVPPKNAAMPIILYFHGNGSHPAWEASKLHNLRNMGYGVLLANYRGYAGNPGAPSEQGFVQDADAYMDMITKSYQDNPVILYGQSIGSGVVVDLAARTKPMAVVLEVPFLSALDVASRFYPYILFIDKIMRDQYRSDLKIRQIHAPILFLLAGRDQVVSYAGGLALYELANQPKTKVVFEDAYHENVYAFGAEEYLIKFLKECCHD